MMRCMVRGRVNHHKDVLHKMDEWHSCLEARTPRGGVVRDDDRSKYVFMFNQFIHVKHLHLIVFKHVARVIHLNHMNC